MRALVAEDTILDGRLALFHQAEGWLAVADLHYGYELSLRAAGALFPLWGMETIEVRLLALLGDYCPAQLLLLGDIVHCRAGRGAADSLLARLRSAHPGCEIVPLLGNHDRAAFGTGELRDAYVTARFCFHHGNASAPPSAEGRTSVVGHHHPAATLRDGAGLSLKLPAFVQTGTGWVLPAFSPWAAGGGGRRRFGSDARFWLCSPRRVFAMPTAG